VVRLAKEIAVNSDDLCLQAPFCLLLVYGPDPHCYAHATMALIYEALSVGENSDSGRAGCGHDGSPVDWRSSILEARESVCSAKT